MTVFSIEPFEYRVLDSFVRQSDISPAFTFSVRASNDIQLITCDYTERVPDAFNPTMLNVLFSILKNHNMLQRVTYNGNINQARYDEKPHTATDYHSFGMFILNTSGKKWLSLLLYKSPFTGEIDFEKDIPLQEKREQTKTDFEILANVLEQLINDRYMSSMLTQCKLTNKELSLSKWIEKLREIIIINKNYKEIKKFMGNLGINSLELTVALKELSEEEASALRKILNNSYLSKLKNL